MRREGSIGGSCCGNPHNRSTGTEHHPPRKQLLPCALSDPCSSLLHLLALRCTEQVADIQREKKGREQRKKETRNRGNSFHQKCPGFGKDSHSVTWVVVLQLRSTPSLPGAHSLPPLVPSFAGNIRDPCMPEPLASCSHRASLSALTLLESASGRTTEGGQEPGHIADPTLFCPLTPPIHLCTFLSPVSSKEHRDLLWPKRAENCKVSHIASPLTAPIPETHVSSDSCDSPGALEDFMSPLPS